MSEKLAEEILKVIRETNGFVLDQAPDVAKQAVLYGRIVEPIGILVGMVVVAVAIWVIRFTHLSVQRRTWEEIAYLPGGVGAGIVGILGLVLFGTSFDQAVLAWIAPKLYLIKYLASTLKGS